MEPIYAKTEFNGYTHRFIVELNTGEQHPTNLNIYANSDSQKQLEDFINEKKSEKVTSFKIIHRATKEEDDNATQLITEFLEELKTTSVEVEVIQNDISYKTTEPCFIQSAFQLKNGQKIIIFTSCFAGITSFYCDEDWKPYEKPFATCSRDMIKDSLTQYHKNIREMHGPECLVKEHSTTLDWE